MAHPKHRQSKTRTAKRRTHDKLKQPALAVLPETGEYYIYHTVSESGYYRGKQVIDPELLKKHLSR